MIECLKELKKQAVSLTQNDYRQFNKLQLECVSLAPIKFSDVGQRALEIAKNYWYMNGVSEHELTNARVDCWREHDSKTVSYDTTSQVACTIRVILCLLDSEPSDGGCSEELEFFLRMMRGAIQHNKDDMLIEILSAAVSKFEVP